MVGLSPHGKGLWKNWLRTIADRLFGVSRQERRRRRREGLNPRVELLEDRTLMSVSSTLNDRLAEISGDTVYLRTDAQGYLQHSEDGSVWSSDLDTSDADIDSLKYQDGPIHVKVDSSGRTYVVQTLQTGGGGFSIDATGVARFEGSVSTQGGDLTVSSTDGIEVAENAVLSTRRIAGTDHDLAPSTGASGNIAFESQNSTTDQNNPFFNDNLSTPEISVANGAKLLAHTHDRDQYAPGSVTLEVYNTSFSLNYGVFNDFAGLDRKAKIAVDGATITGGDVTLKTKAGDRNVIDEIVQEYTQNNDTTRGQLIAGTVKGIVGPLDDHLALPLSIMVKQAEATTTVRGASRILAQGDVSITSEAVADAVGEALYYADTNIGVAFVFTWAEAEALTRIEGTTLIDTSTRNGGNVLVKASTNNISDATSRVSQNIGAATNPIAPFAGTTQGTDTSHRQFSGAVAVNQVKTHAVTTENTVITSARAANVEASAKYKAKESTETRSYLGGQVGLSVSIGITDADVRASVDGRITAMTSGASAALKEAIKFRFDPFTKVDWTTSSITSEHEHGLTTGDSIVYSSGDTGGAIPGLVTNTTYSVIVLDDYRIKLAANKNDALAGLHLRFGEFPTLETGKFKRQLFTLDPASDVIDFGAPHGFTRGEAIRFAPVPHRPITGLNNEVGGTYYVVVVDANRIKLAATSAKATQATPEAINLDLPTNWTLSPTDVPTLSDGAQQTAITRINETENYIDGLDDTPFTTGQQLTYKAVSGRHIGGLVDGQTYTAHVITVLDDGEEKQVLQLKSNGNVVDLDLDPRLTAADGTVLKVQTFDEGPNVIIFAEAPKLGNGTGRALETGDALTYKGALGTLVTGLAEGTTYYAVVNPRDAKQIRLVRSAADALTAKSAGDAAITEAERQVRADAVKGDIDPDYQTTYNDAYSAAYTPAYNTAYNAARDQGQSEAQAVAAGEAAGRTAGKAAGVDAVVAEARKDEGHNWFWTGVGGARQGVEPTVGPAAAVRTGDKLKFAFAHGLRAGDAVVYRGVTSGSLTGLTTDRIYYVIPDPNDATALSLAATSGQATAATPTAVTLGGDANVTVSLDRQVTLAAKASVDTAADLVTFAASQTFTRGERLVYRGATTSSGTSVAVSGLTAGAIYFAIPDPTDPKKLQFAASSADALAGSPIDLTGSVSGEVTLTFTKEAVAAVVDDTANTITSSSAFPFQTGDKVTYKGTGGDPAVTGLTVGTEYYVVLTAANQIKLAASFAAATADTPVVLDLSGGGGVTTVWFEKSTADLRPFRDVRRAVVVDFDFSDTTLAGNQHTIDPGAKGINISAKLDAEDAGKAKVGIGSEPKISDWLTKGELRGAGGNVFKNLGSFDKNSKSPASEAIKKQLKDGDKGPPWELSGSGVFQFSTTDVVSEVGPRAVLRSNANVDVKAEIKHKTTANVETTPSRGDALSNVKKAASFGVLITDYDDTSVAIVHGSNTTSAEGSSGDGAQIDAKKTVTVSSKYNVPWVFPFSTKADTQKYFASDPVGRLASFLGSKAGLDGMFFNTWVRTRNKASSNGKAQTEFALGLGLAFERYENTTEAIVGEDVGINQDLAFRGGDQAVVVTAETDYVLFHSAGNFHIDLAPESALKAYRKGSLGYLYSPFGTQAKGTGVGAAVQLFLLDNRTEARIEQGAAVHYAKAFDEATGKGGMQVLADTAILNVAMGVSGTQAKAYGFSGQLNIETIKSRTTAEVQDGVTITSAAGTAAHLIVNAADSTVLVNVGGAVTSGDRSGFGFTAAINVLDRKTHAILGAAPGELADRQSVIDVGGDVRVRASNSGTLVAVALAATVIAPEPSPEGAVDPGLDPLDDPDLEDALRIEQIMAGANGVGSYNTARSADVAFNLVTHDDAIALIADQARTDGGKNLRGRNLTVEASNHTGLGSLAGAVAVVRSNTNDTTSFAGSLSLNLLVGDTRASVSGVALDVEKMTVQATRTGAIASLAAGAAIALTAPGGTPPGTFSTSTAGSVSINILSGATEAFVRAVSGSLVGDTKVLAEDDTLIVSVAGAVAYGGKSGYGAALSVNVIDTVARAFVADSNFTQTGGAFSVTSALGDVGPGNARIVSVTGSVAASAYSKSGMISVNVIEDTSEAYLSNTSLTNSTGTGLTLEATDESKAYAIGGAVGVGKSGGGWGVAVAYTSIDTDVRAYLDHVTVQGTTATGAERDYAGGATVKAVNDTLIGTGTLAGAGAARDGTAGALNASTNLLSGTTEAKVVNDSNVVVAGAVAITAEDDAQIVSVSGGVGVATNGLAIGGALSVNTLNNTTQAIIDDSRVESTGATIQVTADENALVVAVSLGLGVSSGTATSGSVAVNTISNTTEAKIQNGSDVDAEGTVTVAAHDRTRLISIAGAGGVGTGDGRGFGAAVTVQTVTNNTVAIISHSDVRSAEGGVQVSAGWEVPTSASPTAVTVGTNSITLPTLPGELTSQVVAVAFAGARGGEHHGAIAGAAPVSVVKHDVFAQVLSSNVRAKGNILVTAADKSTIGTGALGLAVGGQGGSGGAALASGTVLNIVLAEVIDSTVASTNGAVTVQGSEEVKVVTIAVGLSGAQGFSLGGSVIVNVVTPVVQATIEGGSVEAQGDVTVKAVNKADVRAGAGSGSLSTQGSSVGAAIVVNVVDAESLATIDDVEVSSSAGTVNVDAESDLSVIGVAVGGAGGQNFALGGSVVVNGVFNTTNAQITNRSIVHSGTNKGVTVEASDDSTIQAWAGTLAVTVASGSNVAIGVSAADNTIDSRVLAAIDNSTVAAGGAVRVHAESDAEIKALTIAGTGSATASGATKPTGFHGAGAGSGNTITNETQALIKGGSLVTTGVGHGVTLLANNESDIEADAGGLSIGFASGAGNSVEVGAALAVNEIDNSVQALVEDSTVASGGAVSITSTSDPDILTVAVGVAGSLRSAGTSPNRQSSVNPINPRPRAVRSQISPSLRRSQAAQNPQQVLARLQVQNPPQQQQQPPPVAPAPASGLSTSVDLAGSGSGNLIRTEVEASIRNSQVTTGDDGAVTLTASDDARIRAGSGALAFSFVFGSGNSGGQSVAVGIAVSKNEIDNQVTAAIDASTVASAGAVTLHAEEDAEIMAVSVAGSVSAGINKGVQAFGGAGAASDNTINNTILATVKGGSVVTTGLGQDVRLAAVDESDIEVDAGGISLGVSNQGGGNNVQLGAAVGISAINNSVQALVQGSTVVSGGAVVLDAQENADILTAAVGVAGAVTKDLGSGAGGSANKFNFTGAGSGARNLIQTEVRAAILAESNAGASTPSTVTSGNGEHVSLSARDESEVRAAAGSLAISGGGGTISRGASVGAAVAANEIENTVEALIDGSTVDAAGAVALNADSDANILAVTIAGAGTYTHGEQGVDLPENAPPATLSFIRVPAIAGVGAGSGNVVTTRVQAAITNSATVTSGNGGAVTVSATDDSDIEADAGGLTLALSSGNSQQGDVSVGAAASSNEIDSRVRAAIVDSSVTSAGAVNMLATSSSEILAVSVGVAGAIGSNTTQGNALQGPKTTYTLAGAGSGAGNTITASTEALIDDSTVATGNGGAVSLTAADDATITVGAGSLAFSVARGGVGSGTAASVGIAVAVNAISSTVKAAVVNSAVHAEGGVSVDASAAGSIKAVTVAGSGSFAQSKDGKAVGFGGAGAGSVNEITNVVHALISDGSRVVTGSTGAVDVSATGTGTITADAGGITLVGASGNTSTTGVSVGAAAADNTITSDVNALVDGSQVNAGGTSFDPAEGKVNVADDTIDLGAGHGLRTGQAVVYRRGTGGAIGNLSDGQTYYVVVEPTSAGKVRLASSQTLALTGSTVDLSSTGGGTGHRLTPSGLTFDPASGRVSVSDNSIDLGLGHGLVSGQAVVYGKGAGDAIGGLTDGATYYVLINPASPTRVKLATTVSGTALDLTSAGTGGGHRFTPVVPGFDAASRVNATDGTIELGTGHGFVTGQAVVYDRGAGGLVGGLTNGGTYYVIEVEGQPGKIRLATSAANANAGTALPLTSGSGSGHRLIPAQTTFNPAGTYVNPADDSIDLGLGHGLVTGQAVVYHSGSGSAIGGLTDGATYYAIVSPPGSNRVKLADTQATAFANSPRDLTSAGTGSSHRLTPAGTSFDPGATRVNVTGNSITLGAGHGLTDGQAVVYHKGSAANSAIGGLVSGTTYYAIVNPAGSPTIQLAATSGGAALDLTSTGTGTGHRLSTVSPAIGSSSVKVAGDTIDLGSNHGLLGGQAVVYDQGGSGNTAIGGLTDGQTYFVISDAEGANQIRLALTAAQAAAGDGINLTAAGSGSGHRLLRGSGNFDLGGNTLEVGDNSIDVGAGHGFFTGQAVTYDKGVPGNSAIGGLTEGGIYYVIVDDAIPSRIRLAATSQDALNDTAINLTATGTGIGHRLKPASWLFSPTSTVSLTDDAINVGLGHDLRTGDGVVYSKGVATNSSVSGLTDGATYFVVVDDTQPGKVRLALTLEQALKGEVIDFSATGSGTDHRLTPTGPVFNPAATRVNTSADTIDLGSSHGLATGEAVVYNLPAGGTPIGGLTPGQVYFVLVSETAPQLIRLAATLDDVATGTAIDLTTAGGSAGHWLAPAGASFAPVAVNVAENTIDVGTAHGFQTGQAILYDAGPEGNAALGGLDAGATYFLIVSDSTGRVRLARSAADALAGRAVDLTGTGAGSDHRLVRVGASFAPAGVKVNTTADSLDLGLGHALRTGTAVVYSKGDSGNSVLGGLTDGATYFAIVPATNPGQVQLATSVADALDGRAIDLTSTGSGSGHSLTPAIGVFAPAGSRVNVTDNTIDLGTRHGFRTGAAVVYEKGTGNTAIGGLADGAVYYIIANPSTPSLVRLAASARDAFAGNAVDLTTSGTGIGHRLSLTSPTPFDPAAVRVSTDHDTIDLGTRHGFVTGEAITYSVGSGGTAIGGLTHGATYYAIADANFPTQVRLASSVAGALLGSAINLTSAGSGSGHSLTAAGRTFDPAAPRVNTSDGSIEVGIGHGLVTGQAVVYSKGAASNTVIVGLTDGATYYVIASPASPTRIRLADTVADARANRARTLTGAGTGTGHRFSPLIPTFDAPSKVSVADDTIDLGAGHGLATGQAVVYSKGASGNNTPGGLTHGATYFAIVDPTNPGKVKLAATATAAQANVAINLTALGSGAGHTLTPGATFSPAASRVNVQDDTIDLGSNHGLSTGSAVVYRKGETDNTVIGGLTDGATYHVIVSPAGSNRVQLAATAGGVAIDLTSTGTGTGHTFSPAGVSFDPIGKLTVADSIIEFGVVHGLSTGTALVYRKGDVGNTPIGGLTDGTTYYAIVDAGSTRLRLALNAEDAELGRSVVLTSSGGGTGHTFSLAAVTFDAANKVDAAANTIDLGSGHGLSSGQEVVYRKGAAANNPIEGLLDGTTYFVIPAGTSGSPGLVQLASTRVAALAGSALDLTATGSGSGHSLSPTVAAFDPAATRVSLADDTIDLGLGHGLATGQAVVYRKGATGNTPIQGLMDEGTYYAIVSPAGSSRIKLAASPADALAGTALNLTGAGSGLGHTFSSAGVSFDPVERVSVADNTLELGSIHGLVTGEAVVYFSGDSGNTVIGGLTAGNTYYVIVNPASPTTVKLATSLANALADSPVDLLGTGTGLGHHLSPVQVSFAPAANYVAVAGSSIDLGMGHGLTTGSAVVYSKGGASNTSIGGLTDGTTYYAIVAPTGSNRLRLALTQADALAGKAILLTSAGSGGGHSLTPGASFDPADKVRPGGNTIEVGTGHGLSTGQVVVYSKGGSGSRAVGGLIDGATYFAIVNAANPAVVSLAASREAALLGYALPLFGTGTGTGHRLLPAVTTIDPGTPSVDVGADTVELGLGHGLTTGRAVVYHKGDSGNAAVGGLTDNATYFAIVVPGSPTKIKLAATPAQALLGDALDLTSPGVGSGHKMTPAGVAVDPAATAADPTADTIELGLGHGLVTGQAVTYRKGAAGNTAIGGLTSDSTYYVIATADPTRIQLATTAENAHAGAALGLTSVGSGVGHRISPVTPAAVATFDPAAPGVSVAANSISLGAGHGLATGQAVGYHKGSDTNGAIGGLSSGTIYFVIVDTVNPGTIKLAESKAKAVANDALDLSATGGGTGHRFTPIHTAFAPDNVSHGDNTIDLGAGHALRAGQAVVYRKGVASHTAVGGLMDGGTYYVILAGTTANPGLVKLAASRADALAGSALDLTSAGTGNVHRLVPTTGVTVTASAEATIKALAWGIAGAATSGKAGGLSLALVGSGSGNSIITSVEAAIKAGSTVTTADGAVTLTAEERSKITAGSGSLSIAFASGSGSGNAAAVGVSMAVNNIQSPDGRDAVKAAIESSTVRSGAGVDLRARANAEILAVTVAGSAGVSTSSESTFGIAGAGAGSGNTIRYKVDAVIGANSTVTTADGGDVTLTAENRSTIKADGGGVSASYTTGSGFGLGVSLGAAAAVNTIDNTTYATIEGSTVTAQGAVGLSALHNAVIQAVTFGIALALSNSQGVGQLPLAGAGSGSGNSITGDTRARIADAGLTRSYVTSGAPLSSGGNRSDKDINLTASENVSILAIAGALAVSFATTGSLPVAIGVSAALNRVTSTVEANINNSLVDAGGGVNLSASTQPHTANEKSIRAVTVAGGVAASKGGDTPSLAFALAGAGSENRVTNTVTASITNSSGNDGQGRPLGVTTHNGGDVVLSATDNADILVDGGGVSVALTAGSSPTSVAIGAGYAKNIISSTVTAMIDRSAVTSAGRVALTADSTAAIKSTAFGVAIAAAFAGNGVAAAGSGAASYNNLDGTILAAIQGGSTVTAAASGADAVSVSSTDFTRTTSNAGAGSLAGAGSVALAAGASIANNTSNRNTLATIGRTSGGSDATTVISVGGVNVTADSEATANATSVAVAASLGKVALAGSGASSTNTFNNTITAAIRNGAVVRTTGTAATSRVVVAATDAPTVDAAVGSGALAIGKVGGSIGVSLAHNTVSNTVSATVTGATVTTRGQAIDVTARSQAEILGKSVATAVAVALGGSAAGADTNSTNRTTTEAFIGAGSTIDTHGFGSDTVSTYGTLTVSADTTGGEVAAETAGGSGGLGSIGVFLAEANREGRTSAYLAQGVNRVDVGDLNVTAESGDTLNAQTISVVIGGLSGAGNESKVRDTQTVEAYLGVREGTTATGTTTFTSRGSVAVSAASTVAGDAESRGGLGAVVGISGNVAETTLEPTVRAHVSDNVTLAANDDLTVRADSTTAANSSTTGVVISVGSVGVSVSKATDKAHVAAYIGKAAVTVGDAITVEADSTDTAAASANASGGSALVGANGARAEATINPDVKAYTGSNAGGATLTANGVTIAAKETPHADADAFGVTVAFAGAVGAVSSDATVNGNTLSYLGTGSTVAANGLTIKATQDQNSADEPTAQATAVGGAGALYGSVIATSATASDRGSVQAYTGTGVTLPDGDVALLASNTTAQDATATGVFVGGLAIGANEATANSGVATTAKLGGDTITRGSRTGALSILATSLDHNEASATAGGGGIVSGSAVKGDTNDTSTVFAGIEGGHIRASTVTILAANTSEYEPEVDSVNASVAGGSGGETHTNHSTSARAQLGNNTIIAATGLVTLGADNQFRETTSDANIEAGAGGVLNGAAARSTTTWAAASPSPTPPAPTVKRQPSLDKWSTWTHATVRR